MPFGVISISSRHFTYVGQLSLKVLICIENVTGHLYGVDSLSVSVASEGCRCNFGTPEKDLFMLRRRVATDTQVVLLAACLKPQSSLSII
ncbi:hypothetical protein ACLOJK_038217 [Asimina triloba]